MRRHLSILILLLLATACGDEAPDPQSEGDAQAGNEEALVAAREAAAVGNWQAAQKILEEEVTGHPGHEAAWVALGNLQARAGRLDAAAAAFVTLAEMRPGNGVYALKAGSFLEASRQSQAAGPHLERAFHLRPNDADAAYRYGLHLFHDGRDAEAAAALERGVQLAPERPDVVLKLAQAESRQGHFGAALDALDQALERRPDAPLLFFQRGLIRARDGRYLQAAADYRRVLELDAEQHRALYALARALTAAGRSAEGQALMEEFAAGEEARRQLETRRLVRHLARAGAADDPEEHRRRLQELALSEPDNAMAHRLLAAAYADEGDYQEAVASYERALRLEPADEESARLRQQLLLRLRGGSNP